MRNFQDTFETCKQSFINAFINTYQYFFNLHDCTFNGPVTVCISYDLRKIYSIFRHVCFRVPRMCLISNGMFASQSTPKMLLDLNKETIFIVALEKMHSIERKIVDGQSGEQNTDSIVFFLFFFFLFWSNYSKWVLKNYTKDLQRGFPHSVRTSRTNFKRLRR